MQLAIGEKYVLEVTPPCNEVEAVEMEFVLTEAIATGAREVELRVHRAQGPVTALFRSCKGAKPKALQLPPAFDYRIVHTRTHAAVHLGGISATTDRSRTARRCRASTHGAARLVGEEYTLQVGWLAQTHADDVVKEAKTFALGRAVEFDAAGKPGSGRIDESWSIDGAKSLPFADFVRLVAELLDQLATVRDNARGAREAGRAAAPRVLRPLRHRQVGTD